MAFVQRSWRTWLFVVGLFGLASSGLLGNPTLAFIAANLCASRFRGGLDRPLLCDLCALCGEIFFSYLVAALPVGHAGETRAVADTRSHFLL